MTGRAMTDGDAAIADALLLCWVLGLADCVLVIVLPIFYDESTHVLFLTTMGDTQVVHCASDEQVTQLGMPVQLGMLRAGVRVDRVSKIMLVCNIDIIFILYYHK